ncbi:Molybdopterin molybdenumtransferase [Georgfuchsia toluolica]|uniref:Molybdopterin molybdenumtransferase n=1 Tax=Georgfuchsia toluolica TaxID=424218 RepID=A0A916N8D5_9PROT|nr:gephyrin-like molybdotransferase Glp [Georgfuchsia toluolica]CAG4883137.1 Molybdopterin molybdenumtransferase [Georgfuchsia toluolica]
MNPKTLSFEDALSRLLAAAVPVAGIEKLPTLEAGGRVLATTQRSLIDVPPHDNSAMDGYAVRVADVTAQGCALPVTQRIAAGSVGTSLVAGTAARIFTGAPVPAGADAVVIQESCATEGDRVVINEIPDAGDNIRRRGEDVAVGSEILPAGIRLTPQALGLAASVGIAELEVFRRLRVAIFSTGDELIMPGDPQRPGAIYNSNRFMLRGLIQGLGCELLDLGIVSDELAQTRETLRRAAAGADLIVTTGGVSVGEEDHVKAAVQAEGELNLWKIAIKPGRPLAFGHITNSSGGTTPFIGLPGNPVASFITFLVLARPFLLKRQGVLAQNARGIMLAADFEWKPADARREFVRARIGDDSRVQLYPHQGSGVLTSTIWADGLVDLAPDKTVARGDDVRYLPFSELLN